jgi:hypothetical protein
MMMYTGAPVSHLQITCIEKTNSHITITVAYPWTPGVPTNSYTNRLEFFGCSNLVDYWWFSLGVTNVSSTTNWIEWSDPDTNSTLKLFRIGNADLDTDGDGLTDAREKLMYHTCPTNSDSDGDSNSDYQEVMVLHTDPNNPDTNKPIVTITYPTNNFSSEWMP